MIGSMAASPTSTSWWRSLRTSRRFRSTSRPAPIRSRSRDEGYNDGTNCGKEGADGTVVVGTPYVLNCKDGSGDLTMTLPKDAKWKFTLDVNGSPTLRVTEDTGNGGGGGEPEPEEDSTIIRVHYVTVVETRDGPAGVKSVEEQKGLGSLSVNVARRGGEPRVYKVEIENLGTNGDIGVADFTWASDAQFAPPAGTVDIFYTLPSGSTAGTTIVVGGKTYSCVAPPAGSPFSCVARDVEVTPFANATMTVKNADGSTRDTIIFNGGSGAEDVFAYAGTRYATTGAAPVAPPAILNAAAHWVNAGTLVYNPPAGTAKVELLYSPNASIGSGPAGITGTFQTITLTSTTNPQPAFNKQLHTLPAWSLGAAAANAKDIARGQLVAVARGSNGVVLAATYVQTPGAIDDLYAAAAYGQPLGVTYDAGVPSLAVWAPTALRTPGVSVNVYDAAGTKIETKPMTLDEPSGIWRVTGTAGWDRKFYTISLSVYSPHYASNAIVANEVTDPYSVSLATDSVRSQFVNLDDADLKPTGWDTLAKPALAAPEDIVIYELHVRDFSIGGPDRRRHRRRHPRRQVHGVRPDGDERQKPPAATGAGRPDARPHPAGVRHRHGQGRPGRSRRHQRPGRGPVRGQHGGSQPLRDRRRQDHPQGDGGCGGVGPDRPATADRRLDARRGRLQLGLRPAALRRAGGQLLDRPERRGPHPRVPPHGQGPERARPAHRHGRGL
jgi:hypothetical protein